MSGAYDSSSLLLPDVIAQHGRWRAGRAALVCGDQHRSWAEFDAATCRVANGLATLGLGRGARLAVLMGNSAEMVEVLFGAARAGVSVVPINLSVTDAAVAAMLADCGAAAIVASGACRKARRFSRTCSSPRRGSRQRSTCRPARRNASAAK